MVWKWLLRENFKPENIVIMGDSSGCGLILATLFKLKELQMTMPAALIFISPEGKEALKEIYEFIDNRMNSDFL